MSMSMSMSMSTSQLNTLALREEEDKRTRVRFLVSVCERVAGQRVGVLQVKRLPFGTCPNT
jgi:hypothetical protein